MQGSNSSLIYMHNIPTLWHARQESSQAIYICGTSSRMVKPEGIKSITHNVHQSPLQEMSIHASDTALLNKSALQ